MEISKLSEAANKRNGVWVMSHYMFYDKYWNFIVGIDAFSENAAWLKLTEEEMEEVRYIRKTS